MLEPSGEGRENFYQQRFFFCLTWYLPGAAGKVVHADEDAIECA